MPALTSIALTPYVHPEGKPLDQIVNFIGTTGNDWIDGNALDNHIVSGGGRDVLIGGAGHDRIEGSNVTCALHGGEGDDVLIGGSSSDSLHGGSGDDELNGGAGDDKLFGGPGVDWLVGGDGDDVLIGGAGRDWLEGGAGQDTFMYLDRSDSTPKNADWLVDFVSGEDKIDLTRLTKGEGLTFVDKFTGQAGEAVLGYDLTIDFTGNGVADFRVMTVGQAVQTDIIA